MKLEEAIKVCREEKTVPMWILSISNDILDVKAWISSIEVNRNCELAVLECLSLEYFSNPVRLDRVFLKESEAWEARVDLMEYELHQARENHLKVLKREEENEKAKQESQETDLEKE